MQRAALRSLISDFSDGRLGADGSFCCFFTKNRGLRARGHVATGRVDACAQTSLRTLYTDQVGPQMLSKIMGRMSRKKSSKVTAETAIPATALLPDAPTQPLEAKMAAAMDARDVAAPTAPATAGCAVNPPAELPAAEAVPRGTDERIEMDIIGVIEGADNSSAIGPAWDCLKHYEFLFRPFRQEPINLAQIGARGGASLRTFQTYFSRAKIICIDNDPECASLAGDRISIHIGSQIDADLLKHICAETPPAIVIDNGSHLAQHIIFTFEQVFPRLEPGGLYIIEGLAHHFGPQAARWQTAKKRSAPEYFLDLARNRFARQRVPGQEQTPQRLHALIDSVTFIDNAVIIRKTFAVRAVEHAVARGQQHIAAHGLGAEAHRRVAAFVLRHGGDPALAEAASLADLREGGRTAAALTVLAEATLQQHRVTEAVATLQEAASRAADGNESIATLHNLARMQAKAGLSDAAAATLDAILERAPANQGAISFRARLRAAPEDEAADLPG
jgi:hypothetical protein